MKDACGRSFNHETLMVSAAQLGRIWVHRGAFLKRPPHPHPTPPPCTSTIDATQDARASCRLSAEVTS